MASGITVVSGGHSEFVNSPSRMVGKFRPRLYARLDKVMAEAVEEARRITETSGTEKSGKAGRIGDTRNMIDSIGYKILQNSAEQIEAEFGFPGLKAFYFYLQTQTGFTHIGGSEIEPTLAIEKASHEAFAKLLQRRY
jgi:hypothetical protein